MSRPSTPSEQPTPPAAKHRRRWWLLGLALLAGLILFAPVQTMHWSGSFYDEEYRLTFVRPDGRPVEGMKLQVLTKAGGKSYLYPIEEYLPDSVPTSGPDGKMVFHHAGRGAEYGGRDCYSVVGVPLSQTGAPQYQFVFLLDGREVARFPYDELRLWGEAAGRAPQVERMWQESDWPVREYVAHMAHWERREQELFDGNQDGRFDREESTARHQFISRAERDLYRPDVTNSRPEPRLIPFAVNERTIVIDVP